MSDYLAGYLDAQRTLEALLPAGVAISIVTYMETFEGALLRPDPLIGIAGHAEALADIPVLPFSEATARRCARMRHQLRAEGKRVRSRILDLMIAATAIEHDLTLVTRNRADYSDIPRLVTL